MKDDRQIKDEYDVFHPGEDASIDWSKIDHTVSETIPEAALSHLRYNQRLFDDKLQAALFEVPIPTDLASRLLLSLKNKPVQSIESDSLPAEVPSVLAFEPNVDRSNHTTKPVHWAVRTAMVASMLLAFGFWVSGSFSPRTLTSTQIAEQAGRWHDQLIANSQAPWHPDWLKVAGVMSFPTENFKTPPHSWTRVQQVAGSDAVAYRFDDSFDSGVLFVFDSSKLKVNSLPKRPPADFLNAKEGPLTACWSANGALYVVVTKNERLYYDLIYRPYQTTLRATKQICFPV